MFFFPPRGGGEPRGVAEVPLASDCTDEYENILLGGVVNRGAPAKFKEGGVETHVRVAFTWGLKGNACYGVVILPTGMAVQRRRPDPGTTLRTTA